MLSANVFLQPRESGRSKAVGSRSFVALPRIGETIMVKQDDVRIFRYRILAVRHNPDGPEPTCDILAKHAADEYFMSKLLDKVEAQRAGLDEPCEVDEWL